MPTISDHIRPYPTDADRPPVAPAAPAPAAPRMVASERLADDCETEAEFLLMKLNTNFMIARQMPCK